MQAPVGPRGEILRFYYLAQRASHWTKAARVKPAMLRVDQRSTKGVGERTQDSSSPPSPTCEIALPWWPLSRGDEICTKSHFGEVYFDGKRFGEPRDEQKKRRDPFSPN